MIFRTAPGISSLRAALPPTDTSPRTFDESLLTVRTRQHELLGVLARPRGQAARPVGVVIVVGGPQTRVGSHRQFVLLARALAQAGYPCLRFDYTGMGDSPGPKPEFEAAGPDIRHACDAVLVAEPGCRALVLWGLCDGATAAVFHAADDPRVAAVIAANPWARHESTRSAALVQTHYGSRLRSRDFWTKLARGRVNVIGAAREAFGHVRRARRVRRGFAGGVEDLPKRLARALRSADRPVHLQLSGNDLTAAEFELALQNLVPLEEVAASILRLDEADHTFSDPAAWSAVIADTLAILSETNARMCES